MGNNKLLQAFSDIVQKQIEEVNRKIDQRFEQIDQRFEQMDQRFDRLEQKVDKNSEDIREIKLTMENDILPRLDHIEACYTSTYRRYADGIEQMERQQADIDMLKIVVAKHSEQLQKLA